MAENVGSVSVLITGDASQLQAEFGATTDAAKQAGAKISESFNQASESAKHASDEGAESLGELGHKLLEVAEQAGVITSAFELFKESFTIYAEIQKTTIALTALTGSASAANEVIEQMEALSKSNAIAFPELLPAAQRMVAMGIATDQLAPFMKAAGNAGWALGESIDDVSTKMASMVLSGMAMPRQLRSIGLASEDLAKVLGITAQELQGVFKAIPEEDRAAAITAALDKFKDAARLPNGLSGAWIELKNSMHGVFALAGSEMAPWATEVVTDLAKVTNATMDAVKAANAWLTVQQNRAAGIKPAPIDITRPRQPGPGDKPGVIPTEGETGPIGLAKAQFDAQEEAAKLHAKEQAANQLAEIAGEQQANQQESALARQTAEEQIERAHQVRQAKIEALSDPVARATQSAQEEIQVEAEKAKKIGDIDKAERDRQLQLAGRTATSKIAAIYEPDQNPNEAAAKAAAIQTDIANQKQAINAKYAAEQETLAANVSKAAGALGIVDVTQQRDMAQQATEAWERSYDAITGAAKKTQDEVDAGVEKQLQTQLRVIEIETKGAGDVAALEIQRQKIDLERVYGLETSHTAAEQIAQARALATFDAEERAQKLASAEAQLKEAEAAAGTMHDQTRIASLTADIAVLKQQNANADAASASAIDQQNQKLTQQLTLEQQIAAAKNAAAGTYQQQQRAIGTNLGNEIGSLPQSIGNDIGGSISNALLGHHPGKSIGQEMGEQLVSTLKSTAAGLLKSLLSGGIQLGLGALGFASGTDSAPGGMTLVGEKGPEIVNLPRGSQVIPNHAIRKYADGTSYSSTAFQTGSTNLHFHAHGMSNPDQFIDHVMRKLPDKLKARSPQFSPYSK